jgi:hypothetical protein
MDTAAALGVEVIEIFDLEVLIQIIDTKEILTVPMCWFERELPNEQDIPASNVISLGDWRWRKSLK